MERAVMSPLTFRHYVYIMLAAFVGVVFGMIGALGILRSSWMGPTAAQASTGAHQTVIVPTTGDSPYYDQLRTRGAVGVRQSL